MIPIARRQLKDRLPAARENLIRVECLTLAKSHDFRDGGNSHAEGLTDGQFFVATVGDEHAARTVSDHQRGSGGHDDRLGGNSTGPEDG